MKPFIGTCRVLISCLGLCAVHVNVSAAPEQTRMIVMLDTKAVASQKVLAADRIESLFPDQRYHANRKLWGAVSLNTASLIRDVENQFGVKATVAFGRAAHGFSALMTPQQVETLKADPRVKDIFEDVQGTLAWSDSPATTPTLSSTYVRGWNLQAIGLTDPGTGPTNDLWSPSSDYRNYRDDTYPVKAYVIDSGIAYHEDLNFNVADSANFDCDATQGAHCLDPGQAGPIQYATQNSCDTHATTVAGVLGARRQRPTSYGVEGVAPNAQLVSVRVQNGCSGSNNGAYTSGVLAAINWIISVVPNNGVDENGKRRLSAVANMSIVWPLQTLGIARPVLPAGAASALTTTILSAVDAGVFFTFAAGNSNEPASNIYPGAIGAMTAGAMSVGAIKSSGAAMNNGAGKVAVYGPSVEIWAPGEDIQTTAVYVAGSGVWLSNPWGVGTATTPFAFGQQYYARETGSSLAAPHVAGAALLVARKYQKAGTPLPSPNSIEWIIQSARQNNIGTFVPPGIPPGNDTTINLLKINNL